jgi:hypothetical protein
VSGPEQQRSHRRRGGGQQLRRAVPAQFPRNKPGKRDDRCRRQR